MAAIFAYTCSCCGQRHEGSPSFGCKAPLHYEELSKEDKQLIATLTDDICPVTMPECASYFARALLELPIHGTLEPFLWGVWVSLSKESFEKYTLTWDDHDESDSYFGWFSNHLPYYPDTVNLKTRVRPRNGGGRPILELQLTDHPLAMHFHHGMTILEAQQIAEVAMHSYPGP